MDSLMIVLLILVILISSITNVFCFFIGAKLGQKIVNKEEIKFDDIKPNITLDPRKIRQHKEEEMNMKHEIEKMDIIMQNIENYDGTDYKQEDVPR